MPNPNETFVELHGHRIVSTVDPNAASKRVEADKVRVENVERKKAGKPELPIPASDDWTHEMFPLINPRREDGTLKHDGIGQTLGMFPTLGLALAEAKKRNLPEKTEPSE